MTEPGPRVVIVGGGFGGIAATKALRGGWWTFLTGQRGSRLIVEHQIPEGVAKAKTPTTTIPKQPKPELQPPP